MRPRGNGVENPLSSPNQAGLGKVYAVVSMDFTLACPIVTFYQRDVPFEEDIPDGRKNGSPSLRGAEKSLGLEPMQYSDSYAC